MRHVSTEGVTLHSLDEDGTGTMYVDTNVRITVVFQLVYERQEGTDAAVTRADAVFTSNSVEVLLPCEVEELLIRAAVFTLTIDKVFEVEVVLGEGSKERQQAFTSHVRLQGVTDGLIGFAVAVEFDDEPILYAGADGELDTPNLRGVRLTIF